MKLKELMQDICVLETNADPETEITGISCDSRRVQPGNAFAAVQGWDTDGNRYIPAAMDRGAAVVITARKPADGISYVLVEKDRLALALISSNFYGHPAQKLPVIGITGTNGKTSAACLTKQLLEKVTGNKVGLIGTVGIDLGDAVLNAKRTTPESPELQKYLACMRSNGCSYAVMEVSSHALDQERVGGITFAVAAFTNLTQDHLDYHKTMESYCDAKARLFSRCRRAVVNADDIWCERLTAGCTAPALQTSVKGLAGLYAQDILLEADRVCFTAVYGRECQHITVPIPGGFTVYNALTALGIALQLGISLKAAAEGLADVKGIRGRVELVPTPGKPYTVMIDYAHTPDGLEKLLHSLKAFCKGRLIAVFGCGGDRDRSKRPQMGEIAVRLADFAVITSDNPRTEDPMAIISDILEGVGDEKNYTVFENRVRAIHYAMDIGKKDDIIVLCGKGHETDQVVGLEHRRLDEREAVRSYLEEA